VGVPTDDEVRELVYDRTVLDGRPPRAAEVAAGLGMTEAEALESFQRLRSRRLLALAPESGEIVMAPPFSAVPTPFQVLVGDRAYFANCVWDAYGIPAALHRDADIRASCACCGEPMSLAVRDGRPTRAPGVAHFAVPAAHWWDDIVYT
jgi:hypothetical protein